MKKSLLFVLVVLAMMLTFSASAQNVGFAAELFNKDEIVHLTNQLI